MTRRAATRPAPYAGWPTRSTPTSRTRPPDGRLRARAGVRDLPDPRGRPPRRPPRAGAARGGLGARPRLGAGPSLPGQVPRHLDAPVRPRRAHQHDQARAQRRQPAAAPAGGAGQGRGHARPGHRGPGRARPRRRRVLGRHRGGRWRASYAGRGGRRPRRGDPADPGLLGRRQRALRGRALPGARAARRARARARHPDLGRRLQAPDDPPDRPAGRRLGAEHGVRRPARAPRPLRRAGRGGRRRRPRARGDPAHLQRLRSLRHRQRLPAGDGRRLGRAAGRRSPSRPG